MEFEWDSAKAARNLTKHGVSFAEAAEVFRDPLALIVPDPDHSADERRKIIVGHSSKNRLLVVSYTERGDRIRIISVRKATKGERKRYEENPTRGWKHE